MKNCITRVSLIAISILLLGAGANGANSVNTANTANGEAEKCIRCHDKLYNMAMQKAYIHRPFLDKGCVVCHVKGENNPSTKSKGGPSSYENRVKIKITWLQKHFNPARTHFFLVPATAVNGKLFVKIRDKKGISKIKSFTLPPLEQLPGLADVDQKPNVSEVVFHGIKRGVLNSATISWQTDKPANAQVLFGIGKLNQKSNVDQQFKTDHKVVLSPISLGKVYDYSVVSIDVHGNKTVSPPATFSTEEAGLVNSPNKTPRPPMQSFSKKKLTRELWAVKDQYFISITANRKTSISIGYDESARPAITMPANDKDNKALAETHVPMKSSFEINITSCLTCHTEYQSEYSHPINVGPKPGMTFPDNYSFLENGKMHCMSCHDSHASNNEARIKESTKQKLCVGCHKSYG